MVNWFDYWRLRIMASYEQGDGIEMNEAWTRKDTPKFWALEELIKSGEIAVVHVGKENILLLKGKDNV